jgi:hypothetical protein
MPLNNGSLQPLPPIVERLIPTFGPFIVGQDQSNYAPEYWHRYQQHRRWRLLIGQGTLEDALQVESATRFHLSAAQLLRLACSNPPETPKPTVSAFCDWIYSLYAGAPDKLVLERGKHAELDIQLKRRARARRVDSLSDVPVSDWKLTHNGLHQLTKSNALREHQEHLCFEIPSLRVGSQPLRASPDLLYQRRETHDTVVVEIKFSNQAIPSNLWPNVWAQLWAYAQIPQLMNSPTIRAVGEVWGEVGNVLRSPPVCLRKVVVHDPRDAAFDSFFRELFDIYRGKMRPAKSN